MVIWQNFAEKRTASRGKLIFKDAADALTLLT